MRLLFVLAYYYPYVGGAERIFQRVAEGLAARGHEVTVVTTRLPGTPAREQIGGVMVERVTTPRQGDRYFFSLLSLSNVLRQAGRFDLLHTTAYNGAPPAFLAARLARRPVVFTALEVLGRRWQLVEPTPWKALAYQLFERMVVRLPYDASVSISQATHADLLGAGAKPRREAVVYCGVDAIFRPGPPDPTRPLAQVCGAEPDDFVYLYVGRPGITKGVDLLIQAAPQIQREIPQARLALLLAHEPRDQYERLRRMCAERANQARITLLPPTHDRNQLAAYLREAGCVVVPSLTEGFGLSAAEACAAGAPVVATRAGSLPEVVSGRTILVEPGDPVALAQGVARAARGEFDPPPPPRDFSWERMVGEYEAIYRSLIDDPRRAYRRLPPVS